MYEAGAVVACVPPVLGFFGPVWYRFEWLAQFRVQYLVVLAGCTVVPLVWKRWRAALAPGALTVIHLCMILPLYFGPAQPNHAGKTWRLLVANVHTRNPAHEKIVRLIQERKPDFVLLLEVNEGWMHSLTKIEREYPYIKARPRGDNFGIALFSRKEMEDARIEKARDDSANPFVVARFGLEGTRLTLIGAHPFPPVTANCTRIRNELLAQVADVAAGQDGAVILAGDFNLTSWSAAFGKTVRRSGLRDSRRGFGVQATWPAYFFPLRVPIDHCLVSNNITVLNRVVGPDIGSDHFPIIVDFCVN